MSDTLTQIITKVQNLLGDTNGTYFTTAVITAATRQALSEWNEVAPQFLAALIPGVNNQYEYELSDEDALATQILNVFERGDNSNELDTAVTYDDYIEDERIFFRLRSPVTSSHTLIVSYNKLHTISGLDSGVESTIAPNYSQAIVNGAAFFSIAIRANARIEANNLNRNVPEAYRELAPIFYSYFKRQLQRASMQKAKVGEPDTRVWNDDYHSWAQ